MARAPGSERAREKAARQLRKHQALDRLIGLPSAGRCQADRPEAQNMSW